MWERDQEGAIVIIYVHKTKFVFAREFSSFCGNNLVMIDREFAVCSSSVAKDVVRCGH